MPYKPILKPLAVVAMLAALAVFYWLGLTSLAGLVHDDVVYLVTGKALAEGLGYRMISWPGAPFEIGYPPLYPLLLAAVWKLFPVFPANLWAFKSLNILCALVTLPLTYRLVVKTYGAPPVQGWLTAGLLALSSFYITFMDLTMSEPLYVALSVLALLVIEPLAEAQPRARTPWAIAAIVLLPILTRSIGLVLAAGVVLWLLLQRRFRLALSSAGAIAVLNAPWLAWSWYAKHQAQTSWDYVSWVGSNTGGFSPAALLGDLAHNAVSLVTQAVPEVVAPVLQHAALLHVVARLHLGALPFLLGLLVTAVTLLGLWQLGRERLRLLHIYLAAYVALILVYPWDPARFVMALAPLLLFAFVHGTLWGTARVSKHARPAGALAAVVLLLSAGGGLLRVASFARHRVCHDALLSRTERLQLADQRALVAWSGTHVPATGVWVDSRDPLIYLLTGHTAVSYGDGAHPSAAFRKLVQRHPTYVVVGQAPDDRFTTPHALLRALPAQLVFTPPGDSFQIYRLAPHEEGDRDRTARPLITNIITPSIDQGHVKGLTDRAGRRARDR